MLLDLLSHGFGGLGDLLSLVRGSSDAVHLLPGFFLNRVSLVHDLTGEECFHFVVKFLRLVFDYKCFFAIFIKYACHFHYQF